MLFFTEFAIDICNFRIDPEPEKYLTNTFNLPLLACQDNALGPKIENQDEKNIENLFDFYYRLDLCYFISEKGL